MKKIKVENYVRFLNEVKRRSTHPAKRNSIIIAKYDLDEEGNEVAIHLTKEYGIDKSISLSLIIRAGLLEELGGGLYQWIGGNPDEDMAYRVRNLKRAEDKEKKEKKKLEAKKNTKPDKNAPSLFTERDTAMETVLGEEFGEDEDYLTIHELMLVEKKKQLKSAQDNCESLEREVELIQTIIDKSK